MHNCTLTDSASDHHYWNIAKKPLKVDYCQRLLSDEVIVAQFNSANPISHLKTLAQKMAGIVAWLKNFSLDIVAIYHGSP
jgi:hypothetical protein